jgi:hypothetical protein
VIALADHRGKDLILTGQASELGDHLDLGAARSYSRQLGRPNRLRDRRPDQAGQVGIPQDFQHPGLIGG